MTRVEVNIERLVRLQRQAEEARDIMFRSPYQARLILMKLHEEIDSIILEGQGVKRNSEAEPS